MNKKLRVSILKVTRFGSTSCRFGRPLDQLSSSLMTTIISLYPPLSLQLESNACSDAKEVLRFDQKYIDRPPCDGYGDLVVSLTGHFLFDPWSKGFSLFAF